MNPSVTVRRDKTILPTYLPAAPDRNPMFLETRVYQGSSGRVYPLPFYDRIAEKSVPHEWDAIYLENEYLKVMILPQLGGRIHRMMDKTNGYDVIYYQPVIKPALVGLAGPWVSGGIEFNWPQHHRPSTFMPANTQIERHPDGAVTVWQGEHDPMARMKGMHGVCLHPGRAVLELKARVHNRTADTQTFLWWANVATRVHERYQSFFPPDANFVADHAKRAMSTFPFCAERYYGVDYTARARNGVPVSELPRQYQPPGDYRPDDLSWYANIPVPTSYMCMGTREDFFGGYDHRERAGVVHVADHHISPGKKQWTWGNHEFGYAWDRNLTDADEHGEHRPYIELMAGVFTDNQPDFSFLQPGETKAWCQCWYPIREIGPAHRANTECALSLTMRGRVARIGVAVTARRDNLRVTLRCGENPMARFTRTFTPAEPLVESIGLPAGVRAEQLTLEVRDSAGKLLLDYTPRQITPPAPEKLAALAATEPAPAREVASADELYLTGLHLEQYRHATRSPANYWLEAIRRDPGDSRCRTALGRWHLRRGEFAEAESHLRAAVARLTHRNPNPADGEAHYQLGRCLRFLGRDDDAYDSLAKAAWNQAWNAAAQLALAEIDSTRGDWSRALERLDQGLRFDTENLRARALRVMLLRQLGRTDEAAVVLRATLALDPLDHWARHLAGEPFLGDTQVRLDLALDFARAGFLAEALTVLASAKPEPLSGTGPLLHYYKAWLLVHLGQAAKAAGERTRAALACSEYCFPARLEEQAILQAALADNPRDARAHAYLGHWLYDRRRHQEAISHWEAAVRLNSSDAVVWRCLGIGYFNVMKNPKAARRAYAAARRSNPQDARLLFEADQLAKRMGDAPTRRLRELSRHTALVAARDDLSVELCTLYNQTGQPARAKTLLASRRFQPWEGGEGQALGQHVRARLLLGRTALAAGNPAAARREFEAALTTPENLGEAKHLLANQSDIYFWLGEACAAANDSGAAQRHWRAAAEFRGDFQAMSVRAYSEMTYYSALALRRIGQKSRSVKLFRALLAYARKLTRTPAKIDYFATSLPTMLLFADDLDVRQTVTAQFLEAQARMGLGQHKAAQLLLRQALQRDPNHSLTADLLSEKTARYSVR